MSIRLTAGGAKLTWYQVQRIRAAPGYTREAAQRDAERLGVHPETVWRARIGKSWGAARSQRLPPEHKECAVCRTRFERRYPGGRYRSDAFWAQKKTCGMSCQNKLAWSQGVFDAPRQVQRETREEGAQMPRSVFVASIQMRTGVVTLGVFSSRDAAVAEIGRAGRLVSHILGPVRRSLWVIEHEVDERYSFEGQSTQEATPSSSELDPVHLLDFGRGPEEAVLRTREGKKVWVSREENNREILEILEHPRSDTDWPDSAAPHHDISAPPG